MHTNFLIEVLDERQREKLFSALLLVNDHNFVEQIIEHSGGVRMRESTIGVVTAALHELDSETAQASYGGQSGDDPEVNSSVHGQHQYYPRHHHASLCADSAETTDEELKTLWYDLKLKIGQTGYKRMSKLLQASHELSVAPSTDLLLSMREGAKIYDKGDEKRMWQLP